MIEACILPEHISPSFQKLIDEACEADAIALKRQVYFSSLEQHVAPFETADPLGEANYRISENCVHQYPNRVLVLATGKCISYCRYCFRREFTSRQRGFLDNDELFKVLDYCNANPEINELLLSGGDPLSTSFKTLQNALDLIRTRCPEMLIRLCTRAIIFAPELFTKELIRVLHNCKPLWIIPHINHPAELGKMQTDTINACINAGIPMQSQTVLLKNVNDDSQILANLFRKLIVLGVKPGYLFQLDTAKGTQHFAVPFKKALDIWLELQDKVSGLSRPEFAVDLEKGGGKFSLSAVAYHNKIINITDEGFSVQKKDKIYSYKDDFKNNL